MTNIHKLKGGYVSSEPVKYSNTATFQDIGPNKFTFTAVGGLPAQQTYGTMPYGKDSWRGFFRRPSAGSDTGGSIYTPANSAFDFGSGAFTMEYWFYQTVSVSTGMLSIANNTAWGSAWLWLGGPASGVNLRATGRTNGADVSISGGSYSLNTWNHVAATRSGSTFRLFLNGTQVNSATFAGSLKSNCNCYIGSLRDTNTNGFYGGFAQDVRVIKGTALYTADFTPSRAPLTAVSGTSLLVRFNGITNKGVRVLGSQNPYQNPIKTA
jgi:hypothetical protein